MRFALSSYKHGFTLFEILITLFIFSVVVSSILYAYSGTFRVVQETEAAAEIYDQARIALERICEDLESTYIPQEEATAEGGEAGPRKILFLGEAAEIGDGAFDTLTFLSFAHIDLEKMASVLQPSEIVYYVRQDNRDAPAVLYRSDTPLPQEKPVTGTGGFPLCEGLSAVDFTYYDHGGEAHESWDASEKGRTGRLPTRVGVVLQFGSGNNKRKPLVFKTSVFISGSKEEERIS